ncbi:MAG TPA: hypothetical protein VN901_14430 [Candidatus Acidoferrales bacterium]|nr:hypothetical protein [Candidatus Acidoferrales bacterium]
MKIVVNVDVISCGDIVVCSLIVVYASMFEAFPAVVADLRFIDVSLESFEVPAPTTSLAAGSICLRAFPHTTELHSHLAAVFSLLVSLASLATGNGRFVAFVAKPSSTTHRK